MYNSGGGGLCPICTIQGEGDYVLVVKFSGGDYVLVVKFSGGDFVLAVKFMGGDFVHVYKNEQGGFCQRGIMSVSQWGAQLLLTNFATRLHGNCNGSNNGMKRGAHTPSPQPWDWG